MDETLGLTYLPMEAATGDCFGANRPGGNLFAESLVAVALYTGERRWRFQLVHLHDGAQYIVLAVSGGNYSGELLAYRLP